VLAALLIRLKGSDGKSLEEMLATAEDDGSDGLDERLAQTGAPIPTLDDLFANEPKRKRDWPS